MAEFYRESMCKIMSQDCILNSRQLPLYTVVDILAGVGLFVHIPVSLLFANSLLADIAQFLFIGMTLVKIIISQRIRINYYFIAMTLYTVILAITYLYTPEKTIGYQHVYRGFVASILIFCVINYVDNNRKILAFVKVYALMGLLAFIYALNVYGTDILSLAASNQEGMRIGLEMGSEENNIINSIGIYAGFSIIISVFLLSMGYTGKYKAFYYLICAASFTMAMLTASKKALLLIFIAVPIIIYALSGKTELINKIKYFLLGLAAMFFMYLIVTHVDAFWFVKQRTTEMFSAFFGIGVYGTSGLSDLSRLDMIKRGFAEFLKAPLLGNGAAYSYTVFGRYSHNNYIELLMNTGLIGLITYYSTYFISLKRLKKTSAELWDMRVLFVIIIISMMFLETALVDYYTKYTQFIMAVISVHVGINETKLPVNTNQDLN
jgi:hypothetical protein